MPNKDGSLIHKVQSGQALWSIAIAYNTKIEELIRLNNLSSKDPIIYIGQELVVFASNGTQTPTAEAQILTESVADLSATPTNTITVITTKTATKRATVTRQLPTPTLAATETPVNDLRTESVKILGNRNIGMIIISVLILGILLMVTGSVSRLKK
jgi:murein DD-endopeptidase MepM/ murein hydrolase activator NlpD